MKKFKIVLALLIIGFLALFMFQNETYFQSRHSLMLNLIVTEPFVSPELPNAVIFFSSFFAGILIAFFYSLMERFRYKKTIKELNTAIKSHHDTITDLKSRLNRSQVVNQEAPVTDKPKAEEPDKVKAENA